MTKATQAEVRKHYEDQDLEVRIDDVASGHVLFRKPGERLWNEGRWVSEYRVVDGQVVLT